MSDTSRREKLADIRERFRELWARRLDLFLAHGPTDAVATLEPPPRFGPPVAHVVRPAEPGCVWHLTAHGEPASWPPFELLAAEACAAVRDLPGVRLVPCDAATVTWTVLLAERAAAEPADSPMHADLMTWEVTDAGVRIWPFEPDRRDRIRETAQRCGLSLDVPTGEADRWCVELPGALRRSEWLLAELDAPQAERRRRGRKPEYDPQRDRRIAEAWNTGHYRRYADLARELDGALTATDVKRAVDRHRKRAERRR